MPVKINRRDLFRLGAVTAAGTAAAYGLPLLSLWKVRATSRDAASNGTKWGMVVDLAKCRSDCSDCLIACRRENNIASFGDPKRDIQWIRKSILRRTYPPSASAVSIPLMCNHCDNPPCVQVCPVKASYQRKDGIVIVDHHRCIGCRYCIIACPYNARYFNFRENTEWTNEEYPKRPHGVSESCTFCVHRVDQGREPACVEVCSRKSGALLFGDLNNPNSKISQFLAHNQVKGIREDLGTKPKVFYSSL